MSNKKKKITHQSLLSVIRVRHSSSSGLGNSETGAYCVCDTNGSVDGFNGNICVPPWPPCNCLARPCFFDRPHGHTQLRRHSATLMYNATKMNPNSVSKIPPTMRPISIASVVSTLSIGNSALCCSVSSYSSCAFTIITVPVLSESSNTKDANISEWRRLYGIYHFKIARNSKNSIP